MIPVITHMRKSGALKTEIARALGVSYTTLRNWEISDGRFLAALSVSAEEAAEVVEKSVFERATGYEIETEKVFQYRGQIVRAPVVEHVPPDVSAARFWLTNRAPDRWQERSSQSVEHKLSFSEAFEQYLSEIRQAPAALEVEAVPVKVGGDD